jgi:predicted DNA-binding transcriptional regulator AlpA
MDDLLWEAVGLAEVARMMGIKKTTLASRLARGKDDFPTPAIRLDCGPIWQRADVERWMEEQNAVRKQRPTEDGPKDV